MVLILLHYSLVSISAQSELFAQGAIIETNDIHPVLPIIYFVMLGMTIGTAVAMEKFPFFPALDTTKLEAEDLLPRRSGFLRPGLEVT